MRVLACDMLVLALVVLPFAVLFTGATTLTLPDFPPPGLSKELKAELGFPIALFGDSSGEYDYPRSGDGNFVRAALLRRHIEVHP